MCLLANKFLFLCFFMYIYIEYIKSAILLHMYRNAIYSSFNNSYQLKYDYDIYPSLHYGKYTIDTVLFTTLFDWLFAWYWFICALFIQSRNKYVSFFDHSIIYIIHILLASQTCVYHVTINDLFYIIINILVLCLLFVIQYSCPKAQNHICNILIVLLTVEFLAQYLASLSLPFKIDMITMYWFVWQFISLMLNWIRLLLLPPILIIEQGSFCMIMALKAWMSHYILLRYIPLTLNLSFLWIFSLVDM